MSSRVNLAAGFACNCIIYSIIYSVVNLYNFYRGYVRKFAELCKLLCIFVLEQRTSILHPFSEVSPTERYSQRHGMHVLRNHDI